MLVARSHSQHSLLPLTLCVSKTCHEPLHGFKQLSGMLSLPYQRWPPHVSDSSRHKNVHSFVHFTNTELIFYLVVAETLAQNILGALHNLQLFLF